MKRKILFLDIDGVLNSRESLGRSTKTGGIMGIDPYHSILVDRIIQATGCEVVLSSSWRHSEESRSEVKRFVDFIDITPTCTSGIRGAEIYMWIRKHVEDYNDEDQFRYAILDDDSDMLLWQKKNFFKTSFDTGLTEDIAKRVIEYLNS